MYKLLLLEQEHRAGRHRKQDREDIGRVGRMMNIADQNDGAIQFVSL